MDAEQETKIEAGVVACLEHCQGTARPYTAVSAYLDTLKADPNWMDAEIIELQTRVIRVLLYRTHPNVTNTSHGKTE